MCCISKDIEVSGPTIYYLNMLWHRCWFSFLKRNCGSCYSVFFVKFAELFLFYALFLFSELSYKICLALIKVCTNGLSSRKHINVFAQFKRLSYEKFKSIYTKHSNPPYVFRKLYIEDVPEMDLNLSIQYLDKVRIFSL